MPHINLAFPFIAPEQFEQFVSMAQKNLSNRKAFKVVLREFKHFNHGKIAFCG